MITTNRRAFLFGVSALAVAVSTPNVVQALVANGHIVRAPLNSKLPFRRMSELMFSCMPESASYADLKPMNVTFYRGDAAVLTFGLHPMATMRWVAGSGSEIVLNDEILSVVVENPQHVVNVTMVSDIEQDRDFRVRRRYFSETFRWKGRKMVLDDCQALDPADAGVLA